MNSDFAFKVDNEINKSEQIMFDNNLKLACLNAIMCVNPSEDCERGIDILLRQTIVVNTKLKVFKNIRDTIYASITKH